MQFVNTTLKFNFCYKNVEVRLVHFKESDKIKSAKKQDEPKKQKRIIERTLGGSLA